MNIVFENGKLRMFDNYGNTLCANITDFDFSENRSFGNDYQVLKSTEGNIVSFKGNIYIDEERTINTFSVMVEDFSSDGRFIKFFSSPKDN